MQVTLELPEHLARRLEPEMDHLAEIIEQGLANRQSRSSGLWREIVSFLARGPRPEEIIQFRSSANIVHRSRELRQHNREGALSPEQKAELDDLSAVDQFMLLVKAEAHRVLAEKPA